MPARPVIVFAVLRPVAATLAILHFSISIVVVAAVPAIGVEPKPGRQPKDAKQPKDSKSRSETPGASLCPQEVVVEQRVPAPPPGWEAGSSGAKSQLSMVTFFDGPPAERASLKYNSELKRQQNWVATWTLAPNSRGYWIQCSYDNTTAVLLQRLPEGATNCKVTYETRAQTLSGLPAVRHVACGSGGDDMKK